MAEPGSSGFAAHLIELVGLDLDALQVNDVRIHIPIDGVIVVDAVMYAQDKRELVRTRYRVTAVEKLDPETPERDENADKI